MTIAYQTIRDAGGIAIGVLRFGDGASIPLVDGNRDYQDYLAWLAVGNVAQEPPAPAPVVPLAVTRFQAKVALLNAGLLAQVEALMANPATPALYRLAWVEALSFERASATVAALGAQLGLSGAQLDALFIAASQIEA